VEKQTNRFDFTNCLITINVEKIKIKLEEEFEDDNRSGELRQSDCSNKKKNSANRQEVIEKIFLISEFRPRSSLGENSVG
jgi:hypothetical protein